MSSSRLQAIGRWAWFFVAVFGLLSLVPWSVFFGQEFAGLNFFALGGLGLALVVEAWLTQLYIFARLDEYEKHQSLPSPVEVWRKARDLVYLSSKHTYLFGTVSLPNHPKYESQLLSKVTTGKLRLYRRVMCAEEPSGDAEPAPLTRLRQGLPARMKDYSRWYQSFYRLWEAEEKKRERRPHYMHAWFEACSKLKNNRFEVSRIPMPLSLDYLVREDSETFCAIGAFTDSISVALEGGFFTRERFLAKGFRENVEQAVERLNRV